MESSQHVQVTTEDTVLVIRLNRPEKLNSLTQDMYAAMNTALDHASATAEIGVVLIAANGDDFSAGNDLKDFMALAMGEESFEPSGLPVVQFVYRLMKFEKPLIVAVQGRAVGIGLTLTLHADLVYLADTAVLSAPFVNLGLVPEAASSKLLPMRIGSARASEVLLAAKPIDATTALDWGLSNQVLPASDLYEFALASAKSVSRKPADALRLSKQLMHSDREVLIAHADQEFKLFFAQLRSEEAKAAFAAFLSR